MPDDLSNRIPQDPSRINLQDAWERQYWLDKFGCTEDELRNAVKAMGASATAVERHLRDTSSFTVRSSSPF